MDQQAQLPASAERQHPRPQCGNEGCGGWGKNGNYFTQSFHFTEEEPEGKKDSGLCLLGIFRELSVTFVGNMAKLTCLNNFSICPPKPAPYSSAFLVTVDGIMIPQLLKPKTRNHAGLLTFITNPSASPLSSGETHLVLSLIHI